MPPEKNHHNIEKYDNQVDRLNNEGDTYGIFKQELEVDTDVNEDANREMLLDESVASFLKSKEKK